MDNERFYCKACKQAFDRKTRIPRVLNQCKHDVCQECLTQLLNTNTLDNAIRCPLCFSKNIVDPRNKKNHHFFKRNQALLSSSFFTASENEIKKCVDHPESMADCLCVSPHCSGRRLVCAQCRVEEHAPCDKANFVKRLTDFNQSIIVDPVSLDVVSFTNEVYKNITKELLSLGSKLRSIVFAIGKALQDEMNVVNKITMSSLNYQSAKINLVYDPQTNTVTASHKFEKEILSIYQSVSQAFMGKENPIWKSLEDHVNRLVTLNTLPLARLTRQHAEFVDRIEGLLEASVVDFSKAGANLVFTPDEYMNLKVYHGKVFSLVEKTAGERLSNVNYSMQEDYNSMLNVSARIDRTFYQEELGVGGAGEKPEGNQGNLSRSFLKSFVDDSKPPARKSGGPTPQNEPGSHHQISETEISRLPTSTGHITSFKHWASNESIALTEDKRRLVFKKVSDQFDHSTVLPCSVYKFSSTEVTRFKIRVNSSFEDLKCTSLEQTANVLSHNGLQWLQFSLMSQDAVESLRGSRLVEKNPAGPGRYRFMNHESSSSLPTVGKMSGLSRMVMFSPVTTYICEYVPRSHFTVYVDEPSGFITGLRLRKDADYYLCLRFLYKDNTCLIEDC